MIDWLTSFLGQTLHHWLRSADLTSVRRSSYYGGGGCWLETMEREDDRTYRDHP